jgi:hypothetical protein
LQDIESLYCGTVYPGPQFFEGCETALCIFSAEWLGMQDAYWIAQHGLRGTCVDLQGDKLAQMREIYPQGWEFVEADAYDFAAGAVVEGRQWDALTLDPWTGQFQQCADLLPTWTTLARKTVVLGHGNYRLIRPEAPEGWTMTEAIKRSDFKGSVDWLVFQKV